ncbi:TolC family protein [Flavobacterium ajazii]|uniref:TolC family protein n=1 Tax=Flavobacterium ajazii TaxID=2692318 RepID=UPI0013D4AEE1|nr:TolC family protein [Flavobacterium ajazii]
MKKTIVLLMICYISNTYSQERFTSLNAVLEYASKNSLTLQGNSIRYNQAKKRKLAAIVGILDPLGGGNLSAINNSKLPVTLFPDVSNPGVYNETKFGKKYNTSFEQNISVKLLNLEGWENLRLAKINLDLTNSNSQITIKELQENIANNYFNIVSLQIQKKSALQNQTVADTLYQIALNKYNLSLVKQQDVNDSKANFLNTKENVNQIEYLIQQNYLSLKNLCDIPEEEEIVIENNNPDFVQIFNPNVLENTLNLDNAILKEKYALRNFEQTKNYTLPNISFIFNQSSQRYSDPFKVFGGTWYKSSYIGLNFSFSLPINAGNMAKKFNAKYEYELTQKATKQARIKSTLNVRNLENEYNKNKSQYQSNNEIYILRKDTYEKNKRLYISGQQSLDQTLNSFNAMVNAEYNLISSKINIHLIEARIDINNKIR